MIAHTRSVEATRALAAAVAELVRPGDLIVLTGDLGAGKTAFAQGFGERLGVDEPITSPTFTIVSQYRSGRLPLYHLDVYRLTSLEEAADIGLVDLLDEGAVTLIEWGDTIAAALPADHLDISLRLGEGDDDRVVVLEGAGARWVPRQRALAAAVAPWRVTDGADSDDEAGGAPC